MREARALRMNDTTFMMGGLWLTVDWLGKIGCCDACCFPCAYPRPFVLLHSCLHDSTWSRIMTLDGGESFSGSSYNSVLHQSRCFPRFRRVSRSDRSNKLYPQSHGGTNYSCEQALSGEFNMNRQSCVAWLTHLYYLHRRISLRSNNGLGNNR